MERKIKAFPEFDKLGCFLYKSPIGRKYLGRDKNGDGFSRLKYYDLIIRHSKYNCFFEILVEVDKNKNRTGFRIKQNNQILDYIFPYTQNGYQVLQEHLIKDLEYKKQLIIDLIELED